MIKVEVNSKVKTKFKKDFYQKTVIEVLEKLNISEAEVSLAVVDEAEIQRLNHKYRKLDSPTDVLSFAENETWQKPIEGYLGEIILAYSYIEKQAEINKVSLEDEMKMLIRHGVLHLLGYSHEQMRDFELKAI